MDTVTVTGKRLTVKVNSRTGFTPEETEKHIVACQMLEEVVDTEEFKARVLALNLTSKNGLTNEQIYNKIMTGAEDLSPAEDNEIDLDVEVYNAPYSKVIGYTNPGTIKTWVNRKFFDAYNYAEVADNVFHEWLHKIGFDHKSATEYTSVPYALGYLVEDMIKEKLAGKVFTPIGGVLPVPVDQNFSVEKPQLVCSRTWRTFWLMKKCYYA